MGATMRHRRPVGLHQPPTPADKRMVVAQDVGADRHGRQRHDAQTAYEGRRWHRHLNRPADCLPIHNQPSAGRRYALGLPRAVAPEIPIDQILGQTQLLGVHRFGRHRRYQVQDPIQRTDLDLDPLPLVSFAIDEHLAYVGLVEVVIIRHRGVREDVIIPTAERDMQGLGTPDEPHLGRLHPDPVNTAPDRPKPIDERSPFPTRIVQHAIHDWYSLRPWNEQLRHIRGHHQDRRRQTQPESHRMHVRPSTRTRLVDARGTWTWPRLAGQAACN